MNDTICKLNAIIQIICIIFSGMFFSAGCTIVKDLPPLKNEPAANIPYIPNDYAIGCGDILNINVWKDAELTRQVAVLPDGTFSFPLIGKVQAKGKTVAELTKILNEKITYYIPEPNLSVEVTQLNSMKVYVLGKVNRPGMFMMNENITVLQALALAGGLNAFADKKKVKIYRQTDDWTIIIPFDYKAVTRKDKTEQNILLKRGDLIVVP